MDEVTQILTPASLPCRSFFEFLYHFLPLLQSPLEGGCYPGAYEAAVGRLLAGHEIVATGFLDRYFRQYL